MKRQISLSLGIFLLLLLPAVAQEPAPMKLPETPAARLLETYIKAFNTGQLAALQEFHAQHDARSERPDFTDAETKDKLRTIMQMMGELKVHRIVESTPTALRVLLTTSKGQWLAVSCEVKAEAPDKLSVLRLERTSTPTDEK